MSRYPSWHLLQRI